MGWVMHDPLCSYDYSKAKIVFFSDFSSELGHFSGMSGQSPPKTKQEKWTWSATNRDGSKLNVSQQFTQVQSENSRSKTLLTKTKLSRGVCVCVCVCTHACEAGLNSEEVRQKV